MIFPRPPSRSESESSERPFGAIDLLHLVLAGVRPALGFDLAVAVLCEDAEHVVPIYSARALSPGVIEGVQVQALAAFVELAGPDHARWSSHLPAVIALAESKEPPLDEPDTYEDAPLVVAGAVTGMLRISATAPLSQEQRSLYFTMASDVSKAIEALDGQRVQAKLVQERLLQSEKMSSVGQLVSGVAHELNNPLTGIMGFAQLLMLRQLDETARKQVETIYNEAERASKIVSNLLTFARRRKAQKEPANLNTLIERVLELRNYDLRVRNIDVTMELDPLLPETMVDTNQLQQVFLNIIINAEQAMRGEDGDAGTLRIATGAEGGRITAWFEDTGPGMSAETVRRIFDPFFTTKEAGDGTGLGMTISYGIVEEHGGRIWAESDPGRGATFFVELPLIAGVAAPIAPAHHDTGGAESNGERRRILVVDDEESIQNLLIGVLEMDGHYVSTASNGREALDRVAQEPFDLIITDVKMPVMSGPDLYQNLSDAGNPLARRVIFITGDTVAPDTRRFLQSVDNAVLAKPFRLRDVRESVRATLAR